MKKKSKSTYMKMTKEELIEEIEVLNHNIEVIESQNDTCFKMVRELEKIVHPKVYDKLIDKCTNGNLTRLGLMDKWKEN